MPSFYSADKKTNACTCGWCLFFWPPVLSKQSFLDFCKCSTEILVLWDASPKSRNIWASCLPSSKYVTSPAAGPLEIILYASVPHYPVKQLSSIFLYHFSMSIIIIMGFLQGPLNILLITMKIIQTYSFSVSLKGSTWKNECVCNF